MTKSVEMSSLQVIDWEVGQALAGGNLATARELLTMLVADLPNDFARIEQSYQENNIPKLHEEVHYLYGAICYCAVPALQSATKTLDTVLKNRQLAQVESSYQDFSIEVKRLLNEFEKE
jgi:two-component system sensor histidine kinase BarA